MAVLNPRRRLVSFRISDEELDQLNQLRLERGIRSLSDLARNAVQGLLVSEEPHHSENVLRERVDSLSEEVSALNQRLSMLEGKHASAIVD